MPQPTQEQFQLHKTYFEVAKFLNNIFINRLPNASAKESLKSYIKNLNQGFIKKITTKENLQEFIKNFTSFLAFIQQNSERLPKNEDAYASSFNFFKALLNKEVKERLQEFMLLHQAVNTVSLYELSKQTEANAPSSLYSAAARTQTVNEQDLASIRQSLEYKKNKLLTEQWAGLYELIVLRGWQSMPNLTINNAMNVLQGQLVRFLNNIENPTYLISLVNMFQKEEVKDFLLQCSTLREGDVDENNALHKVKDLIIQLASLDANNKTQVMQHLQIYESAIKKHCALAQEIAKERLQKQDILAMIQALAKEQTNNVPSYLKPDHSFVAQTIARGFKEQMDHGNGAKLSGMPGINHSDSHIFGGSINDSAGSTPINPWDERQTSNDSFSKSTQQQLLNFREQTYQNIIQGRELVSKRCHIYSSQPRFRCSYVI